MTQIKAHLLGAQACIRAAIDNLDEAEPRKGTIAALQERALSYRRAAEHANQATAEMREQLLRSQVGNKRLREEALDLRAKLEEVFEQNRVQSNTIASLKTTQPTNDYNLRTVYEALGQILSKRESK